MMQFRTLTHSILLPLHIHTDAILHLALLANNV